MFKIAFMKADIFAGKTLVPSSARHLKSFFSSSVSKGRHSIRDDFFYLVVISGVENIMVKVNLFILMDLLTLATLNVVKDVGRDCIYFLVEYHMMVSGCMI